MDDHARAPQRRRKGRRQQQQPHPRAGPPPGEQTAAMRTVPTLDRTGNVRAYHVCDRADCDEAARRMADAYVDVVYCARHRELVRPDESNDIAYILDSIVFADPDVLAERLPTTASGPGCAYDHDTDTCRVVLRRPENPDDFVSPLEAFYQVAHALCSRAVHGCRRNGARISSARRTSDTTAFHGALQAILQCHPTVGVRFSGREEASVLFWAAESPETLRVFLDTVRSLDGATSLRSVRTELERLARTTDGDQTASFAARRVLRHCQTDESYGTQRRRIATASPPTAKRRRPNAAR
jgi:hypothetical protein